MAFYQKLPANLVGRDFIIGDLHGCYDKLLAVLAAVSFNFATDRLFSVGDLVDRGPNSLACLALMKEPWFFCVVGNHESMLLTYLGLRGSDYHRASDFVANGGDWIYDLTPAEQTQLVTELGPLLLTMPVVLDVDHPVAPFHVVHAELMGFGTDNLLRDDQLNEDLVGTLCTPLTWARRLAKVGVKDVHPASPVIEGVHIASQFKQAGLSLTYAGHTILSRPVMYRSHVFLDCGAYQDTPSSELFFIEHGRFVRALAAEGLLP